jgi:hypothetical protein
MSKFVVLLTVYAAVVSTLVGYRLFESEKNQAASRASGHKPFLNASDPADEQVRLVLFEARKLLQDQVSATLKDIDWRLSRIESLREATEDGLEVAERTATEASSMAHDKIAALEDQVKAMGESTEALDALRETLAALEGRLKEVEERPAQIIREVAGASGAPAKPAEPEVKRPTLPGKAVQDPAVVAAEVKKARADIMSDELAVVFPAIEKIRKHRVLDAVPRLLEILATFPEEFGRSAAAAALGRMKIADAVPALAEAVTDKSGLVAQQANKSVRQITGFDSALSASARVRERRTVRNKIKEWWRAHEAEVRERLGQPRAGN